MLRVISIAILILASLLCEARADENRIALVVGISKYEHATSLPNTLNDAKDTTASLKRLGFDVETLFDPNRSALEAAVRRYRDRSAGAEASVFYYSGHALEAGGRNWLVNRLPPKPFSEQMRTRSSGTEPLKTSCALAISSGRSGRAPMASCTSSA